MSSRIVTTKYFRKEVRRLAKKYRSLHSDISVLVAELRKDPTKGQFLGAGLYKIRLAIKSKGRGKSGGGRVVTQVEVIVNTEPPRHKVALVTIYDKSEKTTIDDNMLRQLVMLHVTEEEWLS